MGKEALGPGDLGRQGSLRRDRATVRRADGSCPGIGVSSVASSELALFSSHSLSVFFLTVFLLGLVAFTSCERGGNMSKSVVVWVSAKVLVMKSHVKLFSSYRKDHK